MRTKKLIFTVLFCLVLPAAVIFGCILLKGKHYLPLSLLIIAASLLPFLFSLEQKKIKTRELVLTASVTAFSVISRAAFFFLPNIKPMCGLLILAAADFGASFGFVTGALAMLLSNFMFGQGIWTPFQMLGMAITVFCAALIIRSFHLKNRFVLGILSGVLCFVLYGGIVELSSILMFLSEFNLKSIMAIYASGIVFNLTHAATTAVLVTVFQPFFHEKAQRLVVKYGIFQGAL